MGTDHLDVNKVDVSSLRFHGATPLGASVTDLDGDGDGKPDLLVTFDMADVRLDAKAKAARLTGWLKSSQNFIGEDKIRACPARQEKTPATAEIRGIYTADASIRSSPPAWRYPFWSESPWLCPDLAISLMLNGPDWIS